MRNDIIHDNRIETQSAWASGRARVCGAALVAVLLAGGGTSAQTDHLLPWVQIASLPSVGSSLTLADVNGDGLLDVIATLDGGVPSDQGIRVFLGQPDGSFGDPLAQGGSLGTISAVADFTGDGIPDIVAPGAIVVSFSPMTVYEGHVWLHPGLGDGTFAPPIDTPMSLDKPARCAVGDIDEDGVLDLVLEPQFTGGVFPGSVTMLFGSTDGTFERETAIPVDVDGDPAWNVRGIVLDDLNADGHLDIAVCAFFSGTSLYSAISVLLGHGDGTFESPMASLLNLSGQALKSRDLDDDGLPELIVGQFSILSPPEAITLTIMHNVGSGLFVEHVSYPFIGSVNDLELLDIDGDGITDVAAIGFDLENLTTLVNVAAVARGRGGMDFADPVRLPLGVFSRGFATGDVDRNGRDELLIAWPYTGSSVSETGVSVLHDLGSKPVPSVGVVDTGDKTTQVALADLDGDGHLDVVATSLDADEDVTIALGLGDGSFGTPVQMSGGSYAKKLAVADLDGDDVPDLVVNGDVSGGAVRVFHGTGDGISFGPETIVLTGYVNSIRTADLDGNGYRDIIATRASDGFVYTILSQGGGVYEPAVAHAAGSSPTGLVVDDFTGDHIPDIAVADASSDAVLLLTGNGDGTFAAPLTHSVTGTPQWLDAADLDRDGWLDLVVSRLDSLDVVALLGAGNGTFATAGSFTLGIKSTDIVTADINGDGIPDVLNAHRVEDTITLAIGLGDGTFENPIRFLGGDGPDDLAVGDIDEDGFLDVAVAVRRNNAVWAMLNRSQVWWDIGFAVAGSAGHPKLTGTGLPVADQEITLTATGTAHDAIGLLIIGLQKQLLPLHGGLLVPSVDVTMLVYPGRSLVSRWPKGLDVGTSVYLQAWFVTPSLGGEVSATNALAVIAK